ncbi:hypothetical protein GCM10010121_095260 [Streptomyces brasiliensis]|uniref:Uncharacterized protein n=1 Tax=Streptomyces brasiliensis TaxID=1954 RepID=A0A917UN97_9ACTN|nr:hypothetical protein GCM10010121_095260 [Streptomyces brasiliensis]
MKFELQEPNFLESLAQAVPSPHPRLIAGGEGGVDQPHQRRAQVGPVDEQVPYAAQDGLALAVLAGDRDPLDAHVRSQRKQHQQQPAPQHRFRERLPGCDRGELAGEAGGELGLLEDVDQVDGAPATFGLRLQGDEVLRLLLLAQRRDLDPRLAVLLDDVHPARGAQLQSGVEVGQRLPQPLLEGLDELLRVLRLADRVVVHVAVVLEVRRQIVLRVPPPVRARHPHLPPP